LDAKNKKSKCVRKKQQTYHLKNNNYQQITTCLALEQQKGKSHRVVRFNCDDDSSAMKWIKQESTNKNFQGAFHICQSLNDKMTCLSDVPQNLNNDGNSMVSVVLNSYVAGHTGIESRYQQWRLNPKTNQIVNVETRLCLTSFDFKLNAGTRTCTKGSSSLTMQQQWYFDPIPIC